ncbi:MAG: VCBS repeat-containing protein, partial [Planctomycetota bacterium]|nr:VCBS repeat-containing protein [Planctomycetota bacterium]
MRLRQPAARVVSGVLVLALCRSPVPAADCNGNSLDDEQEIALGLAQDCNGNSVPDACEVTSRIDLLLLERVPEFPFVRTQTAARSVVTFDIDRDGLRDLVAGDEFLVNEGHVDGRISFSSLGRLDLDGQVVGAWSADLTGDGLEDLVFLVRQRRFGNTFFLRVLVRLRGGAETVRFRAGVREIEEFSTTSRRAVALADIDGDDAVDIVRVAGTTKGNVVRLYFNDGSGGFLSRRLEDGGTSPEEVALVDFDGDDLPELLTTFSSP